MRILLYHKKLSHASEASVLDRASQRMHLLKKTVLWDVLLLASLGILGPVMHIYTPLRIPVLAVIFPINESVWEHLKLLFFPTVLVACIRYICTGNLQKGILTTFASGLWRTMLMMICGYYSITGILGRLSLPADIALFYFCSIFLTLYIRKHASSQKKSSLPGMCFLLLMTGCFIWFTYQPPEIGLFQSLLP